jgi:hypothetical protein
MPITSEHYFTGNDGLVGAIGDERFRQPFNHPLALLTFCVLVVDHTTAVIGTHQGQVDGYDAQQAREAARAAAVEAMQ